MRLVLQIISWAALVATIGPPVLYLAGRMTLDQTKLVMLVATIVWFVTTPFWNSTTVVANRFRQ